MNANAPLVPVGTVVGFSGKEIPEGWEYFADLQPSPRRCDPARLNPYDPLLAVAPPFFYIVKVTV